MLNRLRLVELCRPSPAERRSEPDVRVKDGDEERSTTSTLQEYPESFGRLVIL